MTKRMSEHLAAAAMVLVLVGTTDAMAGAPVPPQTCGPETGLQGQVPLADQLSDRAEKGYCRNVSLLSVTDVQPGTERGNVARLEDCVYSGTSDDPGLAVVDISDPTKPQTVRNFPGVGHTWDTMEIHPGRRVLVAKTRTAADDALAALAGTAGLAVYEIGRSCADLTLRATYDLSRSFGDGPVSARQALAAHEFRLTPDGRAAVVSLSIPDAGLGRAGTPSIVVVDLRDLDAPAPLLTVDVSSLLRGRGIPAAALGSHDFDFNPSGTRLYAGLFTGEQLDPSDNAVWRGTAILDIADLWDRRVGLVQVLPNVGGHTARWTRIGKRRVLVTNTEFDCLNGVPVAAPAGLEVVDITMETKPKVLSRPTLEVNATPENCASTAADRTSNWAHFGNFDRRDGASLYFATWSESGVRVFDVRNPTRPREVGYFNPANGASAYSYPTYDRDSRELVWGGPGAGVVVARVDDDVLRRNQGRSLPRPAPRAAWARTGKGLTRGPVLVCPLGADRLGVLGAIR